MFTSTTLGLAPKEQKAHEKREEGLKDLQETRQVDLLKMAKKMKIKVEGRPVHTELVKMIAKKKGLYNG